MLRFIRIPVLYAALATLLCAALTFPSGVALAQVTLPTLPDPVAVSVDPSTTAYLILDITQNICAARPACPPTIPAINSLEAAARSSGALVVFSQTPNNPILPDVTPQPSDPVVSGGADKFTNTDLDQVLQGHGIQTVILVGVVANGAVLYTAFDASTRGYTVVVAEDGLSSATDFDTFEAEYQLLQQPGYSSPTNTPLQSKAVTLSRSDLITFSS